MFILEGNIGAGKSTLLKLIKEQLPHIPVALEPVDDWQKQIYGQSLLTNFYQNSKRWAYTFETFTMINRAKEHIALHAHNALHIVERFKRVTHEHLVDDITIEDPKAYTKPWTAHLDFQLKPWTLGEQFCEDEESFQSFDKNATPEK